MLQTMWDEKRVLAIALFISLSQFQYGFDSAAVAGFQSMPGWLIVYGYRDARLPIGYNVSTTVHTLIQSLMQAGGLVSCILIFGFGGSLSRRTGLWIACAFGVIATAIQIGSTEFAALYIGRLLLGVSNGFFMPYSVIYMGEIAPSSIRGPTVGLVTFATSLGSLLGILVDNYTQKRLDRSSYQIPLAVMLAIPVIIAVGLVFLPDTPRYYVSRGRDEDAAKALRKLQNKDEECILADIAIIKASWDVEVQSQQGIRFKEIFKGANLRRTMISSGASVGGTASGIIFIASFSVYLFVVADIGEPFEWVMYSLAIAISGNLLSFPAMRFIDRRVLLTLGSVLNALIMLAMAAVYTVDKRGADAASKSLVGLSIIYTWIYGVAQGPVLWALQVEVPPQRLRSQVVGFSTGLNFIFAWLCSYCTPYFINAEALNWGPKYCYIWGASNAILAIWVFCCVPETRGLSLEEVDILLEKKVPAIKSARFRTQLRQHAYPDSDGKDVEKDSTVLRIERCTASTS